MSSNNEDHPPRWTNIVGAIAGAVVAVVAVFAFALPFFKTVDSPPDAADGFTEGPYVGTDLRGSGCTEDETGCVAPPTPNDVPGSDCTVPGITQVWGLDPALDALLLDVEHDGDTCTVRPNSVSELAGGTLDDIVRAQSGSVPDVLRECARLSGQPVVACNQPHEIEYVGAQFDQGVNGSPDSTCSELGREYAATTYDGSGVNFGVVEQGDGRFVRCALVTEHGHATTSIRAK